MRVTTFVAGTAVALVLSSGCSYPHLYEKGKIDEDYFARVETSTAKTRGIDFKQRVPHQVITAEEAKKKIETDVDRDNDPADERNLQLAWQALGFMPPGEVYSLAKDEVDLQAEQAAAFYDPREKRFYVSGVTDQARGFTTGFASWALDRDLVSEIVFSHELVHALQDQKYDLEKYDEGANKNDDAELARRAVVEGDATYFGFLSLGLKGLGEVDLKREDMESGASGEAWDKVPVILREQLTFAYWAGNAFHKAIRHGTAGGPPARDPWTDPPSSSAEILHPEKFEAHWKPTDVHLGEIAATTSGSATTAVLTLVRENTVGEFGVRVLLESNDDEDAVPGSQGWRGDRYRVYEVANLPHAAPKPSDPSVPSGPTIPNLALAWRLEFETPEDAQAFVHAYRELTEKKPITTDASFCTVAGKRGAIVLEAPDGPTLAALLPVVGGL